MRFGSQGQHGTFIRWSHRSFAAISQWVCLVSFGTARKVHFFQSYLSHTHGADRLSMGRNRSDSSVPQVTFHYQNYAGVDGPVRGRPGFDGHDDHDVASVLGSSYS